MWNISQSSSEKNKMKFSLNLSTVAFLKSSIYIKTVGKSIFCLYEKQSSAHCKLVFNLWRALENMGDKFHYAWTFCTSLRRSGGCIRRPLPPQRCLNYGLQLPHFLKFPLGGATSLNENHCSQLRRWQFGGWVSYKCASQDPSLLLSHNQRVWAHRKKFFLSLHQKIEFKLL